MKEISDSLRAFLGDDGERVVYSTRQHPIVIIGTIVKMVLVVAVAGVGFWLVPQVPGLDEGTPRSVGFGIVGVLAAVFLLKLAWSLLVWNAERLVISTHKVLHVHGVLSRDISSTPLVKIDELTVRQSLLGRMFKFGRLDVENASGGQEPLHGLGSVPNPGHVYQLITDSARRERMIEGGARSDGPEESADAPTPEEVAAAAAAAKRRDDVGTTGSDGA